MHLNIVNQNSREAVWTQIVLTCLRLMSEYYLYSYTEFFRSKYPWRKKKASSISVSSFNFGCSELDP